MITMDDATMGSRIVRIVLLVGLMMLACISVDEVQGRKLEYTEKKLEVCQREHLNISCGKGEAILMTSAEHGIMRSGRCFRPVRTMLSDVIGCSADVLSHLDAMCSGKSSCVFQYPDDYLHNTKPCPEIYTAYMEVSYICVIVQSGAQNQCRQKRAKVQGHQGFLSSETSLTTSLGTSECPWLIETHPGQNINVTVYHFVNTSWSRGTGHKTSRGYAINSGFNSDLENQLQIPSSVIVDGISHCQKVDVAVIYEAGKRQTVTTCTGGSDGRIIERYVSRTNALEFRFEGQRTLRSVGRFLVEFNVAGCPDLDIPSDTWMKRNGERLEVRCNSSIQIWYLICNENQWVGEVGNCTLRVGYTGIENFHLDGGGLAEPFPYGILFVVAIGVAIGIVFGGGTLALLVIYNKKKGRKKGILGGPGKHYSSMAYHDTNTRAWIHATHNQQRPPKGSQEQLYIDEGIVRDIQASFPPPGRGDTVSGMYEVDTVMDNEGVHHDVGILVGAHLGGGGGLGMMSPQHPLQQQHAQQHLVRGGGAVGGGDPRMAGPLPEVQRVLAPPEQANNNTHVYERPTS